MTEVSTLSLYPEIVPAAEALPAACSPLSCLPLLRPVRRYVNLFARRVWELTRFTWTAGGQKAPHWRLFASVNNSFYLTLDMLWPVLMSPLPPPPPPNPPWVWVHLCCGAHATKGTLFA